ncbi:MAG: GGDEF domain-containing phosphodiesterase, partial [Arenimonas sp.]|uniref:putative bifunctional diguanylate cyclase/phosphodiesterase n=1 Tax=Arenimonas sp. TaxID=1872635 RepID=UPI0025BFD78B
AQRLRSFTGNGVELARTRADGFTFLITANPAKRTVVRLSEGVLAALRTMEWAPLEAAPLASIGITLAERGDMHDPRVLLQQSEEAAEQASQVDRFAFAVYDHEHHAALLDDMRQERALREAFAKGQFELHYQPEFDAGTGQWVAAESLLRWRSGERLVVAGEFIDVLETSDLMLAVGRWVLQQACRDAVDWPLGADGQVISVRVNVSARQFDEPGLLEDITAALQASGLEPARLCLELTETTLMRDIDHALETLRHLRALGVQLAIDDFGTGYASLVYLKRLPINVIKIDRSFVQGMPGDAADMAIVQAIVTLAAAFGIDVVGEGVELPIQRDALVSMGVHRLQGWLYGKAMDNLALCGVLGSQAGG